MSGNFCLVRDKDKYGKSEGERTLTLHPGFFRLPSIHSSDVLSPERALLGLVSPRSVAGAGGRRPRSGRADGVGGGGGPFVVGPLLLSLKVLAGGCPIRVRDQSY